MKITGNNDGKRPKLPPRVKVKTDPVLDDVSASMDIPYRQKLADNRTVPELKKDMAAYSSSGHYHATRGNKAAAKIASREYRNRESAMEARAATDKQDRVYVKATLSSAANLPEQKPKRKKHSW